MGQVTVRIIALLAFLMNASGCGSRFVPPTDQEVRNLFAAHRADFETVRDMAIEDSLSALQISPDGPKELDPLRNRWIDLRNDRSTRQNEYITLLLQMSVQRVDRG
jgi:hypothetical protein